MATKISLADGTSYVLDEGADELASRLDEAKELIRISVPHGDQRKDIWVNPRQVVQIEEISDQAPRLRALHARPPRRRF
jgi:hypothetical protein